MRMQVRGRRIPVDDALRERVRHRFLFALGRFGPAIERVEVRLADVNGPRGGEDKRCRVRVLLKRGGELVVQQDGEDLAPCIDMAADRTRRTVARRVDRDRTVSR